MYTRKTIIINKTGIHARPATDFVKLAGTFSSDIIIKNLTKNTEGNAKSIISILVMELTKGSEIELSAEGIDEKEAVDKLIDLVDSGFCETD